MFCIQAVVGRRNQGKQLGGDNGHQGVHQQMLHLLYHSKLGMAIEPETIPGHHHKQIVENQKGKQYQTLL
jgi:hypothetical protein